MSLDIYLWRYKNKKRPHPALTCARVAEGLPTPELADLDGGHLDALLAAEFPGYDSDRPGEVFFECDFVGNAVFIGLPGSTNDEVIARLSRLAESEGLHLHYAVEPVPDDVEEQIEQELEEHGSIFDMDEDLDATRELAEAGDARAQNRLGTAYSDGEGLPQDDDQAFHWYTRSAEAGDPTGMFNLAWCYRYGRGARRNVAQAIHWLECAMETDKQDAPLALGEIYAAGDGVPVDRERARVLFETAMEHGNYNAVRPLRALKGGQ